LGVLYEIVIQIAASGIIVELVMKLQEKLNHLRKEKGMSQQELADKIGINISYLSRLENGHHEPSIEVLKKFMDIFEVSADFLLNEGHEDYEVRIQDKNLAERVRLMDLLDEEHRTALITVIDSMLTNQKMRELLTQKPAAPSNA